MVAFRKESLTLEGCVKPERLLLAALQLTTLHFGIALANPPASLRTAYAYDTLFSSYYQNSSERPERVVWINDRLKGAGLLDSLVPVVPIDSPMIWIKKVHTQTHIDGIRAIAVDIGNGATRSVGEIADLAVAYALGSVKIVMEGHADNAFANIRPPGHHVVNGGYLAGFCAYTNAVIAATYAREVFGISKILIVDWDYHYGNSTETFFCQDTNIFFAEFGSYASEPSSCNSSARRMITYNIGNGYNEDYLRVFTDSISSAMQIFRPELIIISCGFDLKDFDGLGSYHVTAAGISSFTKSLMDIAANHCSGKIVSLLEGGYHDSGSNPTTWYGLSQCAENHVRTLMTCSLQAETEFFKSASLCHFRSDKSETKPRSCDLEGNEIYNIQGKCLGICASSKNAALKSIQVGIYKNGSRYAIRPVGK